MISKIHNNINSFILKAFFLEKPTNIPLYKPQSVKVEWRKRARELERVRSCR